MRQIKKLWLMFAVVGLFGTAQAKDDPWSYVGEAADGSVGYVNTADIQHIDDNIWFWAKRVIPESAHNEVAWSQAYVVVNCDHPTDIAIAAQVWHRKDGSILKRDTQMHQVSVGKEHMLSQSVDLECFSVKLNKAN